MVCGEGVVRTFILPASACSAGCQLTLAVQAAAGCAGSGTRSGSPLRERNLVNYHAIPFVTRLGQSVQRTFAWGASSGVDEDPDTRRAPWSGFCWYLRQAPTLHLACRIRVSPLTTCATAVLPDEPGFHGHESTDSTSHDGHVRVR